ncbi:hypothetical protein Pmani_019711 [Petrolisthes manimaculis]|uniref:Uncharacterized protein n=1 Tax=Petrolisthes manimaculis TaxID=1843537 RepID=A0AAE1PK84_9EUCA|nr:hypothetical protein Pmani_019711 [Petrolisthes manimaculis]
MDRHGGGGEEGRTNEIKGQNEEGWLREARKKENVKFTQEFRQYLKHHINRRVKLKPAYSDPQMALERFGYTQNSTYGQLDA